MLLSLNAMLSGIAPPEPGLSRGSVSFPSGLGVFSGLDIPPALGTRLTWGRVMSQEPAEAERPGLQADAVAALVARIRNLADAAGRRVLIGIAGSPGSGKTTLARALV